MDEEGNDNERKHRQRYLVRICGAVVIPRSTKLGRIISTTNNCTVAYSGSALVSVSEQL